MNKITTALMAAALTVPALAAAPALAAPGHGHGHSQMDHWKKGEKFNRSHASHYQVVNYRQHRGLKAPPRGYHYVRSGNDILLVGITSGIIASVVANAY